MFSLQQKRDIAAKIERILLDIGHPEMPTEKPAFRLRVEGTSPIVSWADIKPNWYFADGMEIPVINPHNEMQVVRCNPPKVDNSKELLEDARELLHQLDSEQPIDNFKVRCIIAALANRLKSWTS